MAQFQPDHLSDSSDSAVARLLRHVDISSEERFSCGIPQQPRRSPEQHSNALCEDHHEIEPDQYGCFGQDSNIGGTICTVCCEDMKVVAFAKCNHKVICADCMLHMVMLYKIMQCPLCNGDLNQVTVTPWVEPEPPDWSHWANNLHHLWHKPEWSPQIYVSPDHYPGRDQPLHEYCWKMTARACRICDSKVERPFISDGILLTHAAVGQQRHLCIVCLQA
ncbi:TPA: hypothetical protein ACH3X1_014960 [Trebouxia sp. C0004]